MDYTGNLHYEQLSLLFDEAASTQEYLLIPSSLTGFHNTDTTSKLPPDGRRSLCMNGTLSLPKERICPFCGKSHLHVNQRLDRTLKHLPVGNGASS
ncbi:MAG: transposase family protein [Veillonellaceae bacterium]|nr:transposase family protein [Veillonellaceae bacterium]